MTVTEDYISRLYPKDNNVVRSRTLRASSSSQSPQIVYMRNNNMARDLHAAQHNGMCPRYIDVFNVR